MHIIWHGQSCFKIQGKEAILITDPFGKETGLKPIRSHADIITISHNHPSHNNWQTIKDSPKIILGPGEYDIKKVNILGISSFHDKKEGGKFGLNTIYLIEMDGIRICHLGDLGHKLSDTQLDQIDGVDILMIPVGETNLISVREAIEIINEIEPKIVIPMHYKIPRLKAKLAKLEKFCNEMGVKAKNTIPKLTIKQKDLPKEEQEVIILEKQ